MVATTFALDGWNRYIYARCNPLRYSDPTGASIWDIFAIVAVAVVVIALLAAAAFSGGITLPLVGIVISAKLTVATAIGVAGGAIIGGIAAHQAGGSIAEGVLFGGFVGGVSPLIGGALSTSVFNLMGGAKGAGLFGTLIAGGLQGGISGAGTGAAVGFGGGTGSLHDIVKHMDMGFVTGAVTGALIGFALDSFKANGLLKFGTFAKYTESSMSNAELYEQADRAWSPGQDLAQWVAQGPKALPAGVTEFISPDSTGPQTFQTIFSAPLTSNSVLLTIPMGWVPTNLIQAGILTGINDLSMVIDQTGIQSWDQQVALLLGSAPLIGIAIGYGLGDSTKAEHDVYDWMKETFSQKL